MYFANTPDDERTGYFEQWLRCTPLEAYEKLSSADAVASFESDKQAMLPKLLGLDEMVSNGIKYAICYCSLNCTHEYICISFIFYCYFTNH